MLRIQHRLADITYEIACAAHGHYQVAQALVDNNTASPHYHEPCSEPLSPMEQQQRAMDSSSNNVDVFPVWLQAVPSALYLNALGKRNFDILSSVAAQSKWKLPWQLWSCNRRRQLPPIDAK